MVYIYNFGNQSLKSQKSIVEDLNRPLPTIVKLKTADKYIIQLPIYIKIPKLLSLYVCDPSINLELISNMTCYPNS